MRKATVYILRDPRKAAEYVTCRYLYSIRVSPPTSRDTNPIEHRCLLKDENRKQLLQMSARHAEQVGGTAEEIGNKCPFADSRTCSQCDWCA